MKKNIRLEFLAISAGLVLVTTSFALANGTGYNGPDLNPVSIPVELDRGISFDQIQSAVKVCLVTGDTSIGLKSNSQDLAAQMGMAYGSCSSFTLEQAFALVPSPNPSPSMVQNDNAIQISAGVENTWTATPHPEATPYFSLTQGGDADQNYELQVQLGIYSAAGPLTNLSTTGHAFPFVTYSNIIQSPGYDAFGNPIVGTTIVSGLAIQTDASFQTQGAAMPLINTATQQLTQFTVNAQEYVQCLQSELQIQANQN
jgi:hypothetical protein